MMAAKPSGEPLACVCGGVSRRSSLPWKPMERVSYKCVAFLRENGSLERKLCKLRANVYSYCRAWFKYVDKKLTDAVTGTEYSDFLAQLTGKCATANAGVLLTEVCDSADADRGYAYVRFETGDEMSRRAKFAFITWIGSGVSPLKRAKVSTDKAFIKAICVVSFNNLGMCSFFLS